MKKILVTGAGGPAGVNFLRSLETVNEKMELFGTDINIYHKEFAKPWTKEMFIVPRADSKDYVPKINEIIEKNKIEFIHPQPDVEVSAVSENRDKLNAAKLEQTHLHTCTLDVSGDSISAAPR